MSDDIASVRFSIISFRISAISVLVSDRAVDSIVFETLLKSFIFDVKSFSNNLSANLFDLLLVMLDSSPFIVISDETGGSFDSETEIKTGSTGAKSGLAGFDFDFTVVIFGSTSAMSSDLANVASELTTGVNSVIIDVDSVSTVVKSFNIIGTTRVVDFCDIDGSDPSGVLTNVGSDSNIGNSTSTVVKPADSGFSMVASNSRNAISISSVGDVSIGVPE